MDLLIHPAFLVLLAQPVLTGLGLLLAKALLSRALSKIGRS